VIAAPLTTDRSIAQSLHNLRTFRPSRRALYRRGSQWRRQTPIHHPQRADLKTVPVAQGRAHEPRQRAALGSGDALIFLHADTAPITTTVIIAAIGIALPFTSLGGLLGFLALPPAYWIALFLLLMCYVVLTHFVKTWFIRRIGLS
jgi:hypothetical protein